MPEPVAWMLACQTMGGDIGWKLSWSQSGVGICHRLSGEVHEKRLITTTQAEAYANARVREALELAADTCAGIAIPTDHNAPDRSAAVECALAIRALIPSK
jgi:hypothetical protein